MKSLLLIFLIFIGIQANSQLKAPGYLLNSRVEVIQKDGSIKARGTVKQNLQNGCYKVQFDGCFDEKSEIVDTAFLKLAESIEKTDSTLKSSFGKWEVYAFDYPKDQKYGAGSLVPLEIRPDGMYTWYDTYNKPPVINVWLPYAKFEGVNSGIHSKNGIILMDRFEMYWKAYVDKENHLVVKRLCSDAERNGERIIAD